MGLLPSARSVKERKVSTNDSRHRAGHRRPEQSESVGNDSFYCTDVVSRLTGTSASDRKAVDDVLASGYRTGDIAQPECRLVSCIEMGKLVREKQQQL